jgi:hypothetical protein
LLTQRSRIHTASSGSLALQQARGISLGEFVKYFAIALCELFDAIYKLGVFADTINFNY